MFSINNKNKNKKEKEKCALETVHDTKTVTMSGNTRLEVKRSRGAWSKVTDYETAYSIYSKSFYYKETLHRCDGPALLLYYKTGLKKALVWYNKGTIFNKRGGAAIYKFNEHGLTKC